MLTPINFCLTGVVAVVLYYFECPNHVVVGGALMFYGFVLAVLGGFNALC